MTRPIDLERLRRDLTSQAEQIAVALLGEPTGRTHSLLRYGTKGSLAIVVVGDKAGLWRDHEAGTGGDLLELIRRERACDFNAAIAFAGELLARRYEAPPPERYQNPHDKTGAERTGDAVALFRQARSLAGTFGERYLRETREIDLAALPDLTHAIRFHPFCPFGPGVRHPCLLALFRDIATNGPRGVFRIAIGADLKKLGGMSLGAITGAALKIFPDEAVEQALCVAEGLETALSAALIEHKGALLRPIWATGGTANLRAFPVLAGINALTIIADHDKNNAGQAAARDCGRRWRGAGRDVVCLLPDKLGADFNDVLREAAR